mgnify:CR=1 FL=1
MRRKQNSRWSSTERRYSETRFASNSLWVKGKNGWRLEEGAANEKDWCMRRREGSGWSKGAAVHVVA